MKKEVKVGDIVRFGFEVKRIVTEHKTVLGHKISPTYLYVEKEGDRRKIYYSPITKSLQGSFERHSSSFGGSSKGGYIRW
ncbi:MAG TPA: hypothetical protein VIV55_10240 [Flavobacterium sp.]